MTPECPQVPGPPEHPQVPAPTERPQVRLPDRAPTFPKDFFGGGLVWLQYGVDSSMDQRRSRHGAPSPLIRHGCPSSLFRHGLPSSKIHHGRPSPLTCHGCQSSLELPVPPWVPEWAPPGGFPFSNSAP